MADRRATQASTIAPIRDDRRDRRRRAPICQLGHTNLGITSIYLHGMDRAEVIDTVHAHGAPSRGTLRTGPPLALIVQLESM